MIKTIAAVLFFSAAAAVPSSAGSAQSAAPAAAAPQISTSATLGVSTFTVSTLYTGDRFRDPFLPSSGGGAPIPRARDRSASSEFDIHALQLHGIMKDARSDFALFSGEGGATYILRGGFLFDSRNKRVSGVSGRIRIKQKRAELVTADKDVQIYGLGESGEEAKNKGTGRQSDESSSDEP